MDIIIYYAIRSLITVINTIPLGIRKKIIGLIIDLVFMIVPSARSVCNKNMRLVYPDATESEIKELYWKFKESFTRFVIDCMRFDVLSKDWYKNNISVPFNDQYHKLKSENNGKGLLVVSGHMGSIELQAFVAPLVGRSFAFVARPFKAARLEKWWLSRREKYGNVVIGRKGAVARMAELINSGRDVAILIDQNVTLKHAIFTDWFGRTAATSFAAGLIAVETGSRVVLSAIVYDKDDHYTVHEKECDISHIISNPELDEDAKIKAATIHFSEEYQKIIRQYPSEWFWLHRRWKTAPEGVKENFYKETDHTAVY